MTIADEKLDIAKDNIDEAIKNLSKILIDRVEGWDDFREIYQKTLKEVLYGRRHHVISM